MPVRLRSSLLPTTSCADCFTLQISEFVGLPYYKGTHDSSPSADEVVPFIHSLVQQHKACTRRSSIWRRRVPERAAIEAWQWRTCPSSSARAPTPSTTPPPSKVVRARRLSSQPGRVFSFSALLLGLQRTRIDLPCFTFPPQHHRLPPDVIRLGGGLSVARRVGARAAVLPVGVGGDGVVVADDLYLLGLELEHNEVSACTDEKG